MSELQKLDWGPKGTGTAEDAIEHIRAYLQPGRPPCLLLVVVAPCSREREVAHAVLERLPSDITVYEFRFTPATLDAVDLIDDPAASRPGLVCLFGLSELDADSRDQALISLNLARETLRRSKHSFLCFCHPEHVPTFASRACDVYAAMNGLVPLDLPPARDLVPPAVTPLPLVETQLLRRRAELYRRHLESPWVAGESRGQALVDLGEILVRLGMDEEWRKARHEGLRILADREAHAKVLEAYLEDLLAQTETVRLSDLAVQSGLQILTVPLDDIFVPITMVQEELRRSFVLTGAGVTGAGKTTVLNLLTGMLPQEGAGSSTVSADDIEASPATLVASLPTSPAPSFGHYAVKESRPASIQEVLEAPWAVILGDPGSGKSTFLRYVARLFARSVLGKVQPEGAPSLPERIRGLVPIIVPVVRLAARLKDDGRPDIEGFIRNELSNLPGVGATLVRCLKEGTGFLLIDGLDEVPGGLRGLIRDAVEAYVPSYRGICCLATSRIVGYEAARLGLGFAHFRLQDMDDEAIQQFASRWYQTIKETSGVHEGPKVRAARLWQAISASPGIRRIAGNPLLLTIIGLVHYRGSRLPEKRVEVYEAATKTLLENWLARRPFVTLRSDELRRVLPQVAFEVHERIPSGLVPYGWLRGRFTKTLAEARPAGEPDVAGEVDSLLETISQHSGLLLERGWSAEGERLFGFLHLTFQEYLASQHLFERWIDFAISPRHRDAKAARLPENPIYPVLLSRRWQEVVLLAAGRASDTSEATGTRFLQDTLDYNDRYEPILKRRILVASRILGEGPRVDLGLAQSVCEELARFWFESLHATRRAASDVIGRVGRSDYARLVLKPLLAGLGDDDPAVRWAAAEALGALRDPRALEPLLARLEDGSWQVRWAAARALGALRDPRALESLLARLDDGNPDVRRAAVEALGALGTESVVRRLEELVRELARNPKMQAADLAAAREALYVALSNVEEGDR